MRLSSEIGDPACTPENHVRGLASVIFLDGVKQTLVITADEEEGFVKRYKTLPNGLLYRNERFEAETEIVKGEVVIKFKEGCSP